MRAKRFTFTVTFEAHEFFTEAAAKRLLKSSIETGSYRTGWGSSIYNLKVVNPNRVAASKRTAQKRKPTK